MTRWEPEDEIEEALRALRVHDAPGDRVERIRATCLSALAARRPRPAASAGRSGWRGWLEPAVALGLGALYLAEALSRALAAYR
jgi:hypothetical protein